MTAPGGRPVVVASNAAFGLGLVLVVAGLVRGASALTVAGVFVLAVAVGLALVNRGRRATRRRG